MGKMRHLFIKSNKITTMEISKSLFERKATTYLTYCTAKYIIFSNTAAVTTEKFKKICGYGDHE